MEDKEEQREGRSIHNPPVLDTSRRATKELLPYVYCLLGQASLLLSPCSLLLLVVVVHALLGVV